MRLYVPAAKDLVESVATPDPFNVAVPNVVEPFMNRTIPVGKIPPFPFTVAVSGKACPAATEFEGADRVVVACPCTVTERLADLLGA